MSYSARLEVIAETIYLSQNERKELDDLFSKDDIESVRKILLCAVDRSFLAGQINGGIAASMYDTIGFSPEVACVVRQQLTPNQPYLH